MTITVRVALPLYQTVATLLLAYVLMFLPRALVGLRASIAQAPVELERAAMAASAARRSQRCGRSPCGWRRRARRRAWRWSALGITNELTATLMLAPNGTRTLATGVLVADQRDSTMRRPRPTR